MLGCWGKGPGDALVPPARDIFLDLIPGSLPGIHADTRRARASSAFDSCGGRVKWFDLESDTDRPPHCGESQFVCRAVVPAGGRRAWLGTETSWRI